MFVILCLLVAISNGSFLQTDEFIFAQSSITNIAHLHQLTAQNSFLEALIESVNMTAQARQYFPPYICQDPTRFSEYISNKEFNTLSTIDLNTKTQGFEWSYRLALYQYQLVFFRFLGADQIQLRRQFLNTSLDSNPNCFNPIFHVNKEMLMPVTAVLRQKTQKQNQTFAQDASTFLTYHLEKGMKPKLMHWQEEMCRHQLETEGVPGQECQGE
eukprot:m.41918 g.41918  ORF g.41918 m.41918 type:complete len:214 (+) comp16930_c0_seq1:47-688(+)